VTKPRRRQAGEGGISQYATKAGPRFLIKYTAPSEDGSKRVVLKRGYLTRKAAAEALREQLSAVATGTHVRPNKVTVGEHFTEWAAGLRLTKGSVASYQQMIRNHVIPHIGSLRLDQLTGTKLDALYRQLEQSGRVDGKGGLSPRTVRYVATIVHAGLAAAVRNGRLAINPADKADPPSAGEATAPEMQVWTGEQLAAFLSWSRDGSDELYPAWLLLSMTGMRRGEALALQWRDIDYDAGTISVRRSATLLKVHGGGERTLVRPPKSGKARVVDVDPQTLAVLRAHRSALASISLGLARDDAYVLGDLAGQIRHPERFSRIFRNRLAQARTELGPDELRTIRLYDLRHTHATLLLKAGVPVKVVSERLGHSSAMITLSVYTHTLPGMQAEAASKLAAMVLGS
jgi:integrase